GYVEGLYAGGGTNIHGSLTAALAQLKDSQQPHFVLFLTDGLPTVGEKSEVKIVAAAKAANGVRARVLPFGVGFDVNSRLLDRLARENFGMSEYVRPNEDIEAHVAKVYNRIGSPVMTDVAVKFEFDTVKPEDGPVINRQYPPQVFDLFEGEQLVLVGRYKKTGAAKTVVTGRIGSTEKKFDFPAEFTAKSHDSSFAFVEKLWATRRIGEIIDQIDLHGQNDELVKELVALSTKHGILTPYTSFLADETARPSSLAATDSFRLAMPELKKLEEAEGRGAFLQRSNKLGFQFSNGPISGPAAGSGGAALQDLERDRTVPTQAVRNRGSETLYARGVEVSGQRIKLLVTPETSKLDLDKDKDQITTIDRYTDAYFALIQANTPDENQLFVQQQSDEQLLVKMRGKTYLVK
ncbi:MAG: hypothetical protein SH850_02190, partial [Planctomycetaceae bacterium]|nr:hypothetical protein [Planctomycetaceae bacterium]